MIHSLTNPLLKFDPSCDPVGSNPQSTTPKKISEQFNDHAIDKEDWPKCVKAMTPKGHAIIFEKEKDAYNQGDTAKCIELGLIQRVSYLGSTFLGAVGAFGASCYFCLASSCLLGCYLPFKSVDIYYSEDSYDGHNWKNFAKSTSYAALNIFSAGFFSFCRGVYILITAPFNITCPELLSMAGHHKCDLFFEKADQYFGDEIRNKGNEIDMLYEQKRRTQPGVVYSV